MHRGETPCPDSGTGVCRSSYPHTCYETLPSDNPASISADVCGIRSIIRGAIIRSFLRDYGCFPAAEVFVLYVSGATRSPQKSRLIAEMGPMVYIAHAMTPFSPKDVMVYSRRVRLTVFKEENSIILKRKGRNAVSGDCV